MKIDTAEYLQSAQSQTHYPKTDVREIAFGGRSNVGKSSLINTLLGRKKLVRTSKTPGHTRKLNFYLINGGFIFVDLPGYGYANVPLKVREQWQPMVEDYLESRKQLAGFVLVSDIRHPLTKSDRQMISYLQYHGIPVIVAATKADKLSKSRMLSAERILRNELTNQATVVPFSAFTGHGKKDLWKEISALIG